MDRKKKEKTGGSITNITTKNVKKKPDWKKPELTDVSGRVMAQPYIRFT